MQSKNPPLSIAGNAVLLAAVTFLFGCAQSSVLSRAISNASDSDTAAYQIKTDVPVIRITTTNAVAITSEDDYVDGHLALTPQDGSSWPAVDSDLEIKGHGNSSWTWAKKPYKIKLSDKMSLLGMPEQKNWVLLANHDDKTLIRDDVAFELGRRVGMAWTPRSVFVELYLNGVYEGSYQLTESIEIDKNRVNIDSLDDDDIDQPAVTGGYLMEVDYNGIADADFLINGIIPITMHDPSPMADQQKAYITNYMAQVQSVLYGANFADPNTGYAQYLDVDSCVDWYLVNEIYKNNDAIWWSSVYLYKARNGKLSCGPLWDFDVGAGNSSMNNDADPTGWWVRNSWVVNGQWMARLFDDPAFRLKVQSRWNELKVTQFDTLPAYIDQRAAALNQTQQNNFARWPVLNEVVFTEPELAGSYGGEIAYMKTWLTTRINWMDAQINSSTYVTQ
jgi:hypothetical protein